MDPESFRNHSDKLWAQTEPSGSMLDHFGRPRPLQGRVRMRLGRRLDTQMPPQSRSWGGLGASRVARSRPKASPGQPRDAPRARGDIPETPVSAAWRQKHRTTQLEALVGRIFKVCGGHATAPKCVSYRSCQCFIDVGRFARRMLTARKNLEKTTVLGFKIAPRGILGSLGRASWGTKTAKSGSKTRKSHAKLNDFFFKWVRASQ